MAALAFERDVPVQDPEEHPTVVIGADLTITHANAQVHSLLGYAPTSLVGLPAQLLWPVSRRGELKNVRDVLDGQTERRIRSAAQRNDGHVIDVRLLIDPCLDAHGKVVAVTLRWEPIPPRAPASPRTATGRPPFASVAPVSGTRKLPSTPSPTVPAPRDQLVEQLESAAQLLGWLDAELASTTGDGSLRESARLRAVLGEAKDAVKQCVDGLWKLP